MAIPAEDAAAGEIWTALIGQTGQLDKANGRHADDLEVIERCEKRDAATVARLAAPWWRRWLMPRPD